jgi:thioredoxin reductase
VSALIAATGDRIPVRFEARTVLATPGQSLAAALTAAGILALRVTERGSERGMFCGMGVCQECLVVVDGVPNQRACMRKVTAPVTVARQTPATQVAERSSRPPVSLDAYGTEAPQVLVIGGGAGGLAAALAARTAGTEVVLLDDRPTAGGQYYKQLGVHTGGGVLDRQQAAGHTLVEAVARSGTVVVPECEVWGAFPAEDAAADIMATGRDGTRRYRPARLIVATGTYERTHPVPGWTLPGVMTTGAAQTLWRSYRTLAGPRVVIAGNGPLNLQVASELARAGSAVLAVAESAGAPGVRSLGALARMAATNPGLVRDGIRYRAGLARRGVPVLFQHIVSQIDPVAGGLAVTLARLDGRRLTDTRRIATDIVCLGYGFQPANEVLRLLGATQDYDPQRGHLVTRRTAECETTTPGVYAVGDCAGLGGAQAARHEGTIAGLAAARSLGLGPPASGRTLEASARRRLGHARRFEHALWSLFAAPRFEHQLATADTLLCRCEEVSFAQIDATLADARPSIADVKQWTRVGMGRCQGRYCAPVLVALLAERQGRLLDDRAFFAPRVPVKPVVIADLARLAGTSRE